MLPEIALTQRVIDRVTARFGVAPAEWHSGVAPARRRMVWEDVALGRANVVVGARSALFLPFRALSLIVVDEEHDGSYKQEEGFIYQARDLAVARARIESCRHRARLGHAVAGDSLERSVGAVPLAQADGSVRGRHDARHQPGGHAPGSARGRPVDVAGTGCGGRGDPAARRTGAPVSQSPRLRALSDVSRLR